MIFCGCFGSVTTPSFPACLLLSSGECPWPSPSLMNGIANACRRWDLEYNLCCSLRAAIRSPLAVVPKYKTSTDCGRDTLTRGEIKKVSSADWHLLLSRASVSLWFGLKSASLRNRGHAPTAWTSWASAKGNDIGKTIDEEKERFVQIKHQRKQYCSFKNLKN